MTKVTNCSTCDEIAAGEEPTDDLKCPNSKWPCKHHCNHVWSHDACCWCKHMLVQPYAGATIKFDENTLNEEN